MTSIGLYSYSNPLPSQQVVVNLTMSPVVEIIDSPTNALNLQTANFIINVKNRETGLPIPSAALYYKLDAASVYTLLGVSRTLTLSGLGEGAHVVLFQAKVGGVYSEPPARCEWIVDTIAPSIASITPQNNSAMIGIRAPITISFNEAMNASSVEAGVTFTPSIPGIWSNTNKIDFIYVPGVDMVTAQTYVITISTTVKDKAGNALLAPSTFRFTTIPQINYPPNSPTFTGIVNLAATSEASLRVVFNVPVDTENDALHFNVELATNSAFANGYVVFSSITNANSFTYYDKDGNKTSPFPSSGVPSGLGKVIFKTPEPLGDGEYWYRVLANDRR